MWKMIGLGIGSMGIFISGAFVGTVFAETAALVLEIEGATTPVVEPYTEIEGSTEIKLSSGAKLVFQHYQTCDIVTVNEGDVHISEKNYQVLSGTKKVVTQGSCPHKVRCSEERGCETAAILLRGVNNASWIPLELIPVSEQSTFVLAGKRADEFGKVHVKKGKERVGEIPLQGRRLIGQRNKAIHTEKENTS